MGNMEQKPISQILKMKLKDCMEAVIEKESSLRFMVLSSTDGFVIADAGKEQSGLDPKRLSAMGASFAGISYSLGVECGLQDIQGSIVESKSGLVVCRSLNSESMETALVAVFDQTTNHGIALWTLNSVSRDVLEILNTYD